MPAVAGTHDLTVQGDHPGGTLEPTPEERVLEALQDCVLRWGVQKTTVEDVARAAGLSRATVYRLFPGGKSSMVEAGALAMVNDLVAQVSLAVAAAPDLAEGLTALLVVSSTVLAADEMLAFLMEHEQAVVDAQLALGGLDRLLAAVGTGVGPSLERFLGDAERADQAAVWAARTVASYLLDPDHSVSLSDPASARHLVTTYFLPGFAPSH
ncbi:MAG: TetR/AcrR family transcriptional regulator [Actinomycetes bacterium]